MRMKLMIDDCEDEVGGCEMKLMSDDCEDEVDD